MYDASVADYENDKHYAGNLNKDPRNLKDITKIHSYLEDQKAVENIQDVKLLLDTENEPNFAAVPNVKIEVENKVNAENRINSSTVPHVRDKMVIFDIN